MIQGKEVEEEGSYARFMNFVKEFGVVVHSISHGIDISTPKMHTGITITNAKRITE